ncbi:unnamed protein product [Knipowitschia caucasica]
MQTKDKLCSQSTSKTPSSFQHQRSPHPPASRTLLLSASVLLMSQQWGTPQPQRQGKLQE